MSEAFIHRGLQLPAEISQADMNSANEGETLCKKWQSQSGVEIETFLHYFHGTATAYGIQIGRTWQFESATELKALRRRKGGYHPPQSYRYVGCEELGKLMDQIVY